MLLTNTTPEHAPIGTYGLVNVLAAICVVPISYFCAPLGVNIGKNIKPTTLKRIFAVALFIISARMLFSGISYYVEDNSSSAVSEFSTTVEQTEQTDNNSAVENN